MGFFGCRLRLICLMFVFLFIPVQTGFLMEKETSLVSIYLSRPDLQAAFDSQTWQSTGVSHAGFLLDLVDWARQYGWKEYPKQLEKYRPLTKTSLEKVKEKEVPKVSAQSYIILDRHSGIVLAEKKSTTIWPIASLTKLMAASTVLNQTTNPSSSQAILASDEVGGARLVVNPGTKFTLNNLLYAALVGSANNAARALSHSTNLSIEDFIGAMNKKAQTLGLIHTHFVESSGIDPKNISTAREMAKLAHDVFSQKAIQHYTTTAVKYITSLSGVEKKLINTNWMLWKPEFDDVYVTSGKTGYLEESNWNLVVSLRPDGSSVDKEILLVLFGSDSRGQSFIDAKALAQWIWQTHSPAPVPVQQLQ